MSRESDARVFLRMRIGLETISIQFDWRSSIACGLKRCVGCVVYRWIWHIAAAADI